MGSVRKVLAAASRDVQILSVDYGAAIAHPTAVAARVNAFLGGELDEPCMAAVVEPSLYRERGA